MGISSPRGPNYLEVVISGDLSPDELERMAIEHWQEPRKHDCGKIPFDFTLITGSLNVVDIYSHLEQSEKLGTRGTNHAAVVAP